MEIDVVAASEDGTHLLVGEVKWSRRVDWPREVAALKRKAQNLPLARDRKVRLALWAPSASRPGAEVLRLGATQVLDSLR
jgi:hypothetical protein